MKVFQNSALQKRLKIESILIFLIPLIAYSVILVIGLPDSILSINLGTFFAVSVLTLVLYSAFHVRHRAGVVISLSLSLILFAVTLLQSWSTGATGQLVANLLPWNDPNMYYMDAKRLLAGVPFSLGSQRRPIFAGVFAAILGLSQQNLQLAQVIHLFIVALACFFCVWEIRRTFGAFSAALTLVMMALFYRLHVGIVVTEGLGLALGSVGCALLLNGARRKIAGPAVFGVLILSLALNVRAGAFFVLPALIAWGIWVFRKSRLFSWQFLLGGSAAVLAGFWINSFVLKVVGVPGTVSFGNFSYTLYGLIVGSDWRQILLDHAKDGLSDQKIYEYAMEAFRANPLGLLWGSLRAWKEFLLSDYCFSFVLAPVTNLILRILALVGLIACFFRFKNPVYSLILAVGLGNFLSTPFIPPWDSAQMRVLAATIVFILILPGIGVTSLAQGLIRVLRRDTREQILPVTGSAQGLYLLGSFLVFLCFIGPIATRFLNTSSQLPFYLECPANLDYTYFYYDPNSSIDLLRNRGKQEVRLPKIRKEEFVDKAFALEGPAQDLSGFPASLLAQTLSQIPASKTIISTVNLRNMRQMLLVVNDQQVPKHRGMFAACGRPVNKGLKRPDFMLFRANSIYDRNLLSRITPGATSEEKRWPISNLIDGTDDPWGSVGTPNNTAFYITGEKPFKPENLRLTVFTGSNGTHVRDLSVVAANSQGDRRSPWKIIKSRLNPEDPFTEKITIPNLPDQSVVTVELDVTDPNWKEYDTWGFACFSRTKGYRRNYLTESGEGGGIYIRELEFVSGEPLGVG